MGWPKPRSKHKTTPKFTYTTGSFGVADPASELAGLTPRSVRRLVARMRELEASDPLLERFPRLKVGDDASMFWIVP